MGLYGNYISESYDAYNEKVIYSGKQLDDLIKAVCGKLNKDKQIKEAKKSDYHGTSLNVEAVDELSDSLLKHILSVLKDHIKKFEKKYKCTYTWEVKVQTNTGCLIVIDCEINESVVTESFNEVSKVDINFSGVKVTVSVESESKDSPLLSKIDSVVKSVCSSSLYDYLYKLDKKYYDSEINTDDYFDGKKIKSGRDLMNAVKEQITHKNTTIYVSDHFNAIYFCGEYWIDDEHGYSIVFPGGNFVKGKPGDKKFDNKYKPVITYMGAYSDPL